MSTFEVAVVGMGPAGSIAALHLARAGKHVALIDKAHPPRIKVCGGGVVRRAFDHVPADVLLPVQRECKKIELRFLDRDRRFEVRRDATVVAMTMRSELDQALADAACRAGAEGLFGREVRALRRANDHVELETSTGTVRAGIVIAADGATGRCAKLAGWTETLATIPALEAEVRVDPAVLDALGCAAIFDFGGVVEGGYGWLFGKSDHLSCGVLSMHRGQAALHEKLDHYLDAVGVRPVEPVDARGYVIPVAPRKDGFARDRVLLVGDAAGLADPVTAEGISIAMHSAHIAARAILEASDNGSKDASDQARARAIERTYVRDLRREILSELRIARLVAHVLYRRPGFARALFDHAGTHLCEAMADVYLGRRTYKSLVTHPRNWWRLMSGR